MNFINKFLNKEINKYSFNFLVIIGVWLIIPLFLAFYVFFNIIQQTYGLVSDMVMGTFVLLPVFSLSALFAFITGIITLFLKLFSKIFKKNLSAFKLFLVTNSFSVVLSITSFFVFANYEISLDGTAGDGIALYLLLFSMVGNAIFIPLTIITYFILRMIEHKKQDFRINDCKFIRNKFYKIFATLGAMLTVLYLIGIPVIFLNFIFNAN